MMVNVGHGLNSGKRDGSGILSRMWRRRWWWISRYVVLQSARKGNTIRTQRHGDCPQNRTKKNIKEDIVSGNVRSHKSQGLSSDMWRVDAEVVQ